MRWLQYRSAVCSDVLDWKRNHLIATKPASKKGISGWTRIQTKKNHNGSHQAFPDCLSSSIPIHLHTQDTHTGRCLKRTPSRWVLKDPPQSLSSKYTIWYTYDVYTYDICLTICIMYDAKHIHPGCKYARLSNTSIVNIANGYKCDQNLWYQLRPKYLLKNPLNDIQ